MLWACEVLLFIPYSAFMSLTDTSRLLDTECNMPCDDRGVKQFTHNVSLDRNPTRLTAYDTA